MRPWILFLLLFPEALPAGEVLSAEVDYKDERYIVEIDMRINADPGRVYALLTDYEHLSRISERIKESHLIFSLDEASHRTRVVLEGCIAFFCKELTQVQDVEELGGGMIVATVLAEQSDFVYGHSRWLIRPEAGATRVTFNTDLKPAFWVPPLIGPPLIKRELRQASLKTITDLEKLAGPPAP